MSAADIRAQLQGRGPRTTWPPAETDEMRSARLGAALYTAPDVGETVTVRSELLHRELTRLADAADDENTRARLLLAAMDVTSGDKPRAWVQVSARNPRIARWADGFSEEVLHADDEFTAVCEVSGAVVRLPARAQWRGHWPRRADTVSEPLHAVAA